MKIKRISQGLTPIQPFPVEGKGSPPPVDGEDTGGVLRRHHSYFQRSPGGGIGKTPLTALGWCVYSAF